MAPPSTNRPPSINPLRIGRIGTDHLQVFIRSVHGRTELSNLVERLEQLLALGYDAIEVVFEEATAEPGGPLDAVRTATTDATP